MYCEKVKAWTECSPECSKENGCSYGPVTTALNMVKRYRKKPVEIEALQINKNPAEISAFVGEDCEIHNYMLEGEHCVEIRTLEGVMQASEGDYIIKGAKGEVYPLREDVFKEVYEEVK